MPRDVGIDLPQHADEIDLQEPVAQDEARDLRLAKGVCHLGGDEAGVDRHGDGAERTDRQKDGDPLRGIAKAQADMIASLYALRRKPIADACDLACQCGIGKPPVARHNGFDVAGKACGPLQRVGNRCRAEGVDGEVGVLVVGGFCYLNNSALAAELAVLAGRRVAVVDIDVHHGNGTQTIFYDRGDVLTLSVHGDPAYLYPYYAGYADEAGVGEGEGRNRNFPIALGSDGSVYQAAVRSACNEAQQFGADFLVVALGLDASMNDPFACMNVDDESFRRIGEAIAGLRIPTVIVQEGGYVSPFLAATLAAFLDGISQ